ncbi:hypothetical protein GJB61_20870 [Paenibacillus sp. LC-T2]|uniref:Uncharacterized protein n=1 Tax=Paenibacillus monticola TaxID=2666075 RepID=A0A7X2H8K9_9BACL|nr:hypothetical protein [Paenibacillus monticola]
MRLETEGRMNLYAAFLKKQIRNYLFGSIVAVIAVGSVSLNLPDYS